MFRCGSMKIFFQDIQVATRNRTELDDMTRNIEEIVQKSEVKDGLCLVHTTHSTTAIVVNEHEPGLTNDIIKKIRQDFPKGVGWSHDRVDDNADAHLASSYLGPTSVFPVQNGRLIRGTWQNVFLLELDGPRNRRVIVEVMGE
jgi:secondary thiamine-phosphate synthase enzyme